MRVAVCEHGKMVKWTYEDGVARDTSKICGECADDDKKWELKYVFD